MKLLEVTKVVKGKVFDDFDAWCDDMASKGCDRLEQENELTKIHVYAFRPDGRVMGVWHRPQRGNCGVAYNEKDGREFAKNGRKFKMFKKLSPPTDPSSDSKD